jgi:hypothetical protein
MAAAIRGASHAAALLHHVCELVCDELRRRVGIAEYDLVSARGGAGAERSESGLRRRPSEMRANVVEARAERRLHLRFARQRGWRAGCRERERDGAIAGGALQRQDRLGGASGAVARLALADGTRRCDGGA